MHSLRRLLLLFHICIRNPIIISSILFPLYIPLYTAGGILEHRHQVLAAISFLSMSMHMLMRTLMRTHEAELTQEISTSHLSFSQLDKVSNSKLLICGCHEDCSKVHPFALDMQRLIEGLGVVVWKASFRTAIHA